LVIDCCDLLMDWAIGASAMMSLLAD